MPVVKLVLEYDGTRYVGWQVQPNGPSVQAEVERALETLHKAPRKVTAAGRTDAGVHALGQVASFSLARAIDGDTLVRALNANLPESVRPAPVTRTGSLWRVPSARSSSAWTEGPLGWTCQPT